MPLVPQPANKSLGIIDYPPALFQSVVIPLSVFPDDPSGLVGGQVSPSRYAEVVFGPPAAGLVWLVDAVDIASSSASLPDCYVGVTSTSSPSLFVGGQVPPYGGPDQRAVLDSTPNGWNDAAFFNGLTLTETQCLAVLWIGVTVCEIVADFSGGPPVIASCSARVHYRLAAVV